MRVIWKFWATTIDVGRPILACSRLSAILPSHRGPSPILLHRPGASRRYSGLIALRPRRFPLAGAAVMPRPAACCSFSSAAITRSRFSFSTHKSSIALYRSITARCCVRPNTGFRVLCAANYESKCTSVLGRDFSVSINTSRNRLDSGYKTH